MLFLSWDHPLWLGTPLRFLNIALTWCGDSPSCIPPIWWYIPFGYKSRIDTPNISEKGGCHGYSFWLLGALCTHTHKHTHTHAQINVEYVYTLWYHQKKHFFNHNRSFRTARHRLQSSRCLEPIQLSRWVLSTGILLVIFTFVMVNFNHLMMAETCLQFLTHSCVFWF